MSELIKTPEEIMLNSNERDLFDRVIAYVIVTDKETYQRQIYRLHLDTSNNRDKIIPAAKKQIKKHSTLTALLWTTDKKKKRLYVRDGDILIKDQEIIPEMWKELCSQETEDKK